MVSRGTGRLELELAGWLVLHFTWQQVVQHPGYVLAMITRTIAQAEDRQSAA